MPKYPDDVRALIIDDLFDKYDLCIADGEENVHVYCHTCGDIVCVIDFDDVVDLDELDLYERIVKEHRKI